MPSTQALDAAQLVDIIITRPTVTLSIPGPIAPGLVPGPGLPGPPPGPPVLACAVSYAPLPLLTFMRDHAIVTDRGMVMGRLADPQRRFESRIAEAVFRKLGARFAVRDWPDAFQSACIDARVPSERARMKATGASR